MKNIHVIPTDKETRLYLSNYGKELNLASHPKTLYTTGQHIYITSDEEIKKGDWFYNTISLKPEPFKACENGDGYVNCSKYSHYRIDCKKIILTTDQDLIKDGVQAIPDEFLEWFVKNPSCEEVKVESKITKDGVWTDLKGYVELPTTHSIIHKIIIPKECMITKIMQMDAKMAYDSLPKQETLSGFEEGHRANLDWIEQNSNQTKQETLEEVAERYIEEYDIEHYISIEDFIMGAKWQQERGC